MTAFERITESLRSHGRDVQMTGLGRASVQCPNHEDRNASLSITATADRSLLFCHAGCPTVDVLAALGLTLRDLYDKPRGAELARYTYTNAAGTPDAA